MHGSVQSVNGGQSQLVSARIAQALAMENKRDAERGGGRTHASRLEGYFEPCPGNRTACRVIRRAPRPGFMGCHDHQRHGSDRGRSRCFPRGCWCVWPHVVWPHALVALRPGRATARRQSPTCGRAAGGCGQSADACGHLKRRMMWPHARVALRPGRATARRRSATCARGAGGCGCLWASGAPLTSADACGHPERN